MPRFLLQPGNTKLGVGVWNFSLPAVTTCPGSSGMCRKLCYARHGNFVRPNVRDAHRRNYEATKKAAFVQRVWHEINLCTPRFLRWHVSGDFYSAEYIEKIIQIVRWSRRVTHYAYTRSWRVPELQGPLQELAAEPNFRLWLSADEETGPPPCWDRRAGVAYMAKSKDDEPTFAASITFFDTIPWKERVRFFHGSLVCPYDQGGQEKQGQVNCVTCGYCMKRQPVRRWWHKSPPPLRQQGRRIKLELV